MMLPVIKDISLGVSVTGTKLFQTFDAPVDAENMVLVLHQLCVLKVHCGRPFPLNRDI